jgi:flagellar hook-length control protein FliK
MPVSTAPVTDAAAARDPKSCANGEAPGFGATLKQEIAARSTDGQDAAVDEPVSTDASAEEKTDDVAVTDSTPALDPALAALLGDSAVVQQPVAVPVQPVQQAALAAAETGTAEASAAVGEIAVAEGKRAGVQRERPAVDRGTSERVAERAVARGHERGMVERTAADKGNAERGTAERPALERVPGELREMRAARDADERGLALRDKSGTDAPATPFLSGFTVDRGATGSDAPMPVTAAAAALDSLAAASLGAKWGAPVAASGAEASAASATARVDTPLGTSGWGDAFQQKVVWMVDRQLERAELHINPPHLGPVDVMLNLSADGAQIAFTSPHAAVREAIEASLPDLRSALDQRGLSLGQASVGADSGAAREQFAEQAREAARNAQNGRSGSDPLSVEAPTPARAAVARRGLVDTFA